MVEYKLLKQRKYYSISGCYTSYGILAFKGEKLIRTVADISANKTAVENLIEKFNKYELDPCHLSQAIEDYLYDQRTD
ncbi:MAG: hypothetical protein IJD68_04545 [Ruminococcus sp.]|nr:hypothetical protein [Ruminococcus sp.]